MRMGDLIIKQSKSLLENRQQAKRLAILLSVLPFVSWLSVAIVALVSLRKGAKCGFDVMLPALVLHSVPLMMLVPWDSALVNTILEYVPCYLAALALRKSGNWQYVFGMLFLQAAAGFMFMQVFMPEFPANQWSQFQVMFSEYKEILDASTEGMDQYSLVQLFMGFQILGVMASSLISLLFARSTQSKLFVPGGFAEELSAFRCGKLSLLLLIAVSLASYYGMPLGNNLLPMLLIYFLLSGFNLAHSLFSKKRQMTVTLLLLLLIFTKPMLVLFAYILFGSLDSIFNFRLYLRDSVRKTV